MATDNTFEEVIKWGAIAVAAYLLYQYLFATPAAAPAAALPPGNVGPGPLPPGSVTLASLGAAASAPGGGGANDGQVAPIGNPYLPGSAQWIVWEAQNPGGFPAGTTAPPVTYAPVANESQTASALIDAAGGVNSLNVDQWNYYWAQVGGTALTSTQGDLVKTAAGGDNPMNVDAYLKAVAAAGLPATLPGLSGLGAVPLPVPLVFAYGHGGRPILLFPGSGKAAA